MNNKEILKKRWKDVDRRLNEFMKKYKSINLRTQDRLQEIFDGIKFTVEDVNKYISEDTRQKLERYVKEFKKQGILTGYFGYNVENIMSKSKIKNIDMLEILITGCYMLEMKLVNEIEMELFEQTTQQVYKEGIEEAKPKKRMNFILPDLLLATILSMPNSKGYIWQDYKEATAEYNASQIKRQILIDMQQGRVLDINNYEFQKIITSQNKRYINKKKDQEQEDKFSGMLDDELATIVNQVLLQAYKDAGIEKVLFVAVIDDKTTKMCSSLNGQIFSINGINKFKRYSDEEGKKKKYKIKGLETGINLPPINDHFHWCRSTIIPSE